MTRFSDFSDEELDAIESALCNEGLKQLVTELRNERKYRDRVARIKVIRCPKCHGVGFVPVKRSISADSECEYEECDECNGLRFIGLRSPCS